MQILLYVAIGAGYALLLTITIVLARTYRRTREIGFIWLGAAVIVWPLLGRLVESGLRVDALAPTAAVVHFFPAGCRPRAAAGCCDLSRQGEAHRS